MNSPPIRVRLLVLGTFSRTDDAAALLAARRVQAPALEVIQAGRPGAGLVNLLDIPGPLVLADVTRSSLEAGTVTVVPLGDLPAAAIASRQVSSHGFGPAESLRLMSALGRQPPPGLFAGLEGGNFATGEGLSEPVTQAMDAYVRALEDAITKARLLATAATTLRDGKSCTSRA